MAAAAAVATAPNMEPRRIKLRKMSSWSTIRRSPWQGGRAVQEPAHAREGSKPTSNKDGNSQLLLDASSFTVLPRQQHDREGEAASRHGVQVVHERCTVHRPHEIATGRGSNPGTLTDEAVAAAEAMATTAGPACGGGRGEDRDILSFHSLEERRVGRTVSAAAAFQMERSAYHQDKNSVQVVKNKEKGLISKWWGAEWRKRERERLDNDLLKLDLQNRNEELCAVRAERDRLKVRLEEQREKIAWLSRVLEAAAVSTAALVAQRKICSCQLGAAKGLLSATATAASSATAAIAMDGGLISNVNSRPTSSSRPSSSGLHLASPGSVEHVGQTLAAVVDDCAGSVANEEGSAQASEEGSAQGKATAAAKTVLALLAGCVVPRCRQMEAENGVDAESDTEAEGAGSTLQSALENDSSDMGVDQEGEGFSQVPLGTQNSACAVAGLQVEEALNGYECGGVSNGKALGRGLELDEPDEGSGNDDVDERASRDGAEGEHSQGQDEGVGEKDDDEDDDAISVSFAFGGATCGLGISAATTTLSAWVSSSSSCVGGRSSCMGGRGSCKRSTHSCSPHQSIKPRNSQGNVTPSRGHGRECRRRNSNNTSKYTLRECTDTRSDRSGAVTDSPSLKAVNPAMPGGSIFRRRSCSSCGSSNSNSSSISDKSQLRHKRQQQPTARASSGGAGSGMRHSASSRSGVPSHQGSSGGSLGSRGSVGDPSARAYQCHIARVAAGKGRKGQDSAKARRLSELSQGGGDVAGGAQRKVRRRWQLTPPPEGSLPTQD